jgi:putative transposase
MKYQFVAQHTTQWPVARLCRTVGVSVSGYYAWRHRPLSQHVQEDAALAEQIRAIHVHRRHTYGCPRIHAELQADGIRCSRKRIGRLLRQQGLVQERKRRTLRTTESDPQNPVAPNLLQQDFSAAAVNTKWITDITYVATEEGWLYLSAIEDVYSRMIVGWAMSAHIDEALITSALRMALARRSPISELIHHSDRGSQYTSHGYQELLHAHGIHVSMSSRGNCYDNAMAESFWARLKVECLYTQHFKTHAQARSVIFEYIEVFYNRQRRHSGIGYLSPVEFEANQTQSVGSSTP